MSVTAPTPPPRPITVRAAENGLFISIYIIVLMLSAAASCSFPPASLVVWVGSLALPVVLYKLLMRNYRAGECSGSFPEVWAEGIASFFLGSLMPALVAYALLRYVAPDFIAAQYQVAIDSFQALGTADGERMARTLIDLRSRMPLPTAVDVAAQLISFNIVVGTALSLLAAVFIKMCGRRKRCSSDCNP